MTWTIRAGCQKPSFRGAPKVRTRNPEVIGARFPDVNCTSVIGLRRKPSGMTSENQACLRKPAMPHAATAAISSEISTL
jgi:hypothetical protein